MPTPLVKRCLVEFLAYLDCDVGLNFPSAVKRPWHVLRLLARVEQTVICGTRRDRATHHASCRLRRHTAGEKSPGAECGPRVFNVKPFGRATAADGSLIFLNFAQKRISNCVPLGSVRHSLRLQHRPCHKTHAWLWDNADDAPLCQRPSFFQPAFRLLTSKGSMPAVMIVAGGRPVRLAATRLSIGFEASSGLAITLSKNHLRRLRKEREVGC